MNKIYKVIWSKVKNSYVVVPEITDSCGKSSGRGGVGLRALLCAMVLAGGVSLPLGTVHATNPGGTGNGVAWGAGSESGTDQNNVAIGAYAKSLGQVALALGAHSESSGAYSTAVGGGSHATAKNAAAIGPWSEARAENAVAVGATAKSLAEYAMAVGGDSMASAKNAVALGAKANASKNESVAIGAQAESSGEYAAAIGGGAKAKNKHAIAVGSLSEATGEASLAVGNNSKASNNYAYAIGGSSRATGQWTIAMGTNATAMEDASVAIGTWSEATKGQATGIGYQAKARAIGATALGRLSLANAVDGTAIGSSTSVTGLNGTAIGNKANVTAKNGVAIGNQAAAAHENAVAIGSGSVTATAVGTASESVNGVVHNFAGGNPGSTVSVGKAGEERTITNVAAGRISDTSTDAINGSQLYAVNTEVNKGVVYAGDVKAAAAADNKFTQRLGVQTNVVGGVADESKLSDNNIGVVSNGTDTLNVKLAKELKGLTSVTTGNTVMNTDGVTITGGPKIVKDGIDAGGKQITNVASGGNVITNGANIGDINRIVEAKDKYVTGGTATYQGNGEGTAALKGTNGLTANVTGLKNNYVTSGSVSNDGKTLTLERNDTGKVNVDLSNVFTEVAKGDYRLVANPAAGSQGKYKPDSNGDMVLTVANDKGDTKQVTLTDIASKTQQDANTTNITNINTTVAKGLNFKGDDATVLNKQLGEQLDVKGGADASKLSENNIGVVSGNGALNVKLAKELKDLTSVTTGDTVMNSDGLTINNGPKIVKTGIDAGSKKITNVAAGTDGTDAVNVDQLNAAIGGTAKATTVKAKDTNVTVKEGVNGVGGKEFTVGLGDKVTLGADDDKKVVVDGTTGKITAGNKVTIDGTTGDIQAGTVKVTGAGTVNELTNRTWDIDNPTVVHGQAATEDQLKTVSDGVKTNKTDITNINNTIAKGLSFKGDDATVINKKLGEQLDIKGGADASKLSNGNIGVVSENGALNVKLAKELKDLTSVTTGDTVMNTDGVTITGGPKIVKTGIDAGGKKITNVAAGTDNTDAVNFGQLKDAVAAGKTILKDGKNTTVEGDGSANNPYKVNVNDDLVLGKKGADGKDGSIGVNGKDGSAVVINGKDGSIGLNGKDGANGLTIKGGDGKPGLDGTNITRLIIEDKNGGTHEVATMDDGMKYGGDTGTVIKKKLNEQVNVIGGITDESKLTTDDNIGVVSDGSNNLKVRLAKALKGLESVTTGDTVMNSDGLTINGGPKIVKNGIDAGGKKITNVAAGDVSANSTDAVNGSQLHEVKTLAGQHTTVKAKDANVTVTEGTNDAGGKEYTVGLGDKVTLGSDPSKQVSIDGTTGIIKAGDKVTIDSTTGNIDAGKVKINGKDGTVNELTNKTWDPNNFTSGQAATEDQLKAVDKKITNTSEELTKKGMDFAGNEGEFHRNLGEKVTIKGEGTKAASEYSGENIKTIADENGNITVKMDKNLKTETIVATGKDGKDGKIGINGKDGKTTNISVTRDGKPGVDGAPGTTTTRIVYEKPDGSKEEVATLNDGMKYGGDTGAVIKKKLNEQVNVIGGITDETKLTTEDNLGVVSDGSNNLKVKMAKDLKGLNSVTTGNTVMNNNGLTIKNGPSITETGVDAGGKRITNVAAGKADTDAVNVSQLKQIGGAINKIDNRMNRVGAGAAALAALHPLDFDPDDKWDFTLGYGNYKDAHALALGAFYRPNEDTMISVGSSMGGGENMVNAGLSVKLGQGNHVSTSKVAMAKELKDLRAELENVKGALMKVSEGKQLDSLDMDKMQIFPDVPENHWAYDYVATLAGNGVIVGYPDGQFGGDRMMTRYEMAALIYRAMQNGAAADERMARALKEFEPELERIRVDTISKNKDGTPDIQRVRVIKGRG